MTASNQRQGLWLMSAGGALLGTLGLFLERSGTQPLAAVWFRCAFGLLALLAWGAATRRLGELRLRGRMLAAALAAGALVVFNWASFFAAIERTSIGVATVVVHVQPIWVMLLGAWWWRERISARQALAVPLALLGLALASGVLDESRAAIGHDYLVGLALCLVGSFTYAIVTLLAKAAQGVGSYAFATWQCGVGALALAWWPWLHGWPPLAAWGWLAGLGVLHTGLAYVLMYAGMAKLPTARIAVLQFVYPAVAVLVDQFVFDRVLSPLQWGGVALMGLALWGANRGAQPMRRGAGKIAPPPSPLHAQFMTHSFLGRRGIAVAPHSLASESALRVLREGGNALEAMIAAAATIAVVYPHMNSIGGDGFWVIGGPNGPLAGIDASGASASAASIERYAQRGIGGSIPFRGGMAALTVAGTISGWGAAHALAKESGGRLPLARLLEDAIWYAREGIPVTHSQHAATAAKLGELQGVAGFAQSFLIDGKAPAAFSNFRQPRLAATLARIAEHGSEDFYRGALARQIAAELAAVGSPLTADDLAAHHARRVDPLTLAIPHATLANMTPPSQGVVSLMILGIMQRLPGWDGDPLGAPFVHAQVEATKQAFALRDRYVTDPAFMSIAPADLLRAGLLDELAANIDMQRAAPWGRRSDPGDTVWMGVIDAEGRAVSFIQSIYHEFGAGVVLAGSGINWQNRGCSFSLDAAHVNALAPRKRPFHTLNPALARLGDGRLMVYGTMGGDGQPQTQATVFNRIQRFGLEPQAAIELPRWVLGRTWGLASDSLKLEARFPSSTIAALRALGHEVELLADWDESVGHAGALIRHDDGLLIGGFDPRSNGAVAAF